MPLYALRRGGSHDPSMRSRAKATLPPAHLCDAAGRLLPPGTIALGSDGRRYAPGAAPAGVTVRPDLLAQRQRDAYERALDESQGVEEPHPYAEPQDHLDDPVTFEQMKDPVTASDGQTYDLKSLLGQWLTSSYARQPCNSPFTRRKLEATVWRNLAVAAQVGAPAGEIVVDLDVLSSHGRRTAFAPNTLLGPGGDQALKAYFAEAIVHDPRVARYLPFDTLRGLRETRPAVAKVLTLLEYARRGELSQALTDPARRKAMLTTTVRGESGEELRVDFSHRRGVMKELVAHEATTLQFASQELRGDIGLLREAVRQNPEAFRLAPEPVRSDPEALKSLVEDAPRVLAFSADRVRRDVLVVVGLARINPAVVAFASDEVTSDPRRMAEIVHSVPSAIDHLPEATRAQRQFWVSLGTLRPEFIKSAHRPGHVELDQDFYLEILKRNGRWIPHELRSNREFALAAVRIDPWVVQLLDPSLRDDDRVIRAAVEKDGGVLQFASDRLRQDPKTVGIAVHQHFEHLEHADPSLREDFWVKVAVNFGVKRLWPKLAARRGWEWP